MKEILMQTVQQISNPVMAKNVAHEFLQTRILAVLQKTGAMIPLAFHGGTALRFLYLHGRFSEGLDFSLAGNREMYDLAAWLRSLQTELSQEGYDLEIKLNDQKTVNSALLRFPGLLYDLQLSPMRSAILSIKIEVDTNPPAGAGLATTVVRRYFLLQLHHHDPATLFAGKLHAVLQRPYTKGRDIYDLFWYLGDARFPLPNFVYLNNALAQTGWTGPAFSSANWRNLVMDKAAALDWQGIQTDVLPFMDAAFDPDILNLDHLRQLLKEREDS